MQFVFHALEPDSRTWSFPPIEARLEALGFRFIGTAHVDEPPPIREHVDGDMHDEDIAQIDAASHRPWPVFWHPELRTYSWLSGWLDGQPIVEMRTDFEDGSVLRSETRFRRMPRWQSKVEDIDTYMLAAHRPEVGSHVLIAPEDPDRHHAAHQDAVAATGGTPTGSGSIQAYLHGLNRMMAFKNRISMQPLAVALLYQFIGVVLIVTGLTIWALLEPGPRTFGTGLALLGLVLIGAARTFPDRLPQPRPQLPS